MQPQVGIVMGSSSDHEIMNDAATVLERFDVAYEIHVVSAHRTPEAMIDYARTARSRGLKDHHRRSGRRRPPTRHAGCRDDATGDWRARRASRASTAWTHSCRSSKCPVRAGGRPSRSTGRPTPDCSACACSASTTRNSPKRSRRTGSNWPTQAKNQDENLREIRVPGVRTGVPDDRFARLPLSLVR